MSWRWPHEDLDWLLRNGHWVRHEVCAVKLMRSQNAVRVMAGRLRKEARRVEAARKLRAFSCETQVAA